MGKKIVVLDADKEQCLELCAMLEGKNYPAVPEHSFSNLQKCLKASDCLAVFIDIDTVTVTNRDIRELALANPGIYYFCLSKYRFHPELKDAICYHVYACLNRPVDPDELFYWIRSIYEDYKDDTDPTKSSTT